MEELGALVEQFTFPLAVRSSSLLEDSLHQILAGAYATVMLPNTQDDPLIRLRYLADAIKTVYASTSVTSTVTPARRLFRYSLMKVLRRMVRSHALMCVPFLKR